MLEPLLSQQRKGIFQCCFPPPVFAEVVAEKLCHFGILLRPGERHYGFKTTLVSQVFSNVTELILVKGRGNICFYQYLFFICKMMSVFPTCTIPRPLPSFSVQGKIQLHPEDHCFSAKKPWQPDKRNEKMHSAHVSLAYTVLST